VAGVGSKASSHAGVVLDNIVTVVDAKHIQRHLQPQPCTASHGFGLHSAPASITKASHRLNDASEGLHEGKSAPSGDNSASNITNAVSQQIQGGHVKEPKGMPMAATSDPSSDLHHEHLSGAVNEAQRQLAYADIVLLNKTDLVSQEHLVNIDRAIRKHNASVKVSCALLWCLALEARWAHDLLKFVPQ
jgi:G3E family GTPase